MKRLSIILAVAIFSLSFFQESAAKSPLIGVSASENSPAAAPSTYIKSIRKAGGVPVVIPMTTEKEQLEKILATVDGILMTGGEDIDPLKYYGEEPLRAQGEIVPYRDEFDCMLIKMAVEKGLPLLGICRGEQLLNVVFGGTLYQDIPSQAKDSYVKHRQQAPSSYGTHSISIEKGSILNKVLGTERAVVNSFHHQAVKDPAPGFKVIARAADGIIEGIQMNEKVFGLQFHPEGFVANGDDTFLPIFQYFVEKANEYQSSKK